MVPRRFPRPKEIAPPLKCKAGEPNGTKCHLDKALTVAGLWFFAKRRSPETTFDYTGGPAYEELSLSRASEGFHDIESHPAILRDVLKMSTSRVVRGKAVDAPFGIGPTCPTRMAHAGCRLAGARINANWRIPFTQFPNYPITQLPSYPATQLPSVVSFSGRV